jgi:hypothetical protein
VFSGTTGKLIADGGQTIAALTSSILASADAAADAGDVATLSTALSAIPAAGGVPVDVTKATASAGVSGAYARQDHKHDIDTDFAASVVRTTAQFVGATSGTPAAAADAGSFESCTTSSGALRGLCHRQASADANGARVVLQKSRGTHASPSAHVGDDHLGSLVARGHDGSAFYDAGIIRHVADADGGTSKRARVEVLTHDGNALVKLSTTVPARLVTTNATKTTALTIAIPSGSLVDVSARWHGRDGSGNEVYRTTNFVYRRLGAAAPAPWGTPNEVFPTLKDDAAWGTPAYEISGNNLLLTVTGKASTDITWDVEITYRVL